ncbi:Olfactory receptor 8J3 [Myotis davidii]|uniref:Olfactory receptor 8J3 n=2 Tax=Myotis davidii TaxID=225400 RepID=L5MBN3_MYODS|nr:Olfactory receptor 8J3 [Myotis davidii]
MDCGDQQNLTVLTEFILVGITDHPELQATFFGVFLIVYAVSVAGNVGMIILTKMDSRLQTPMYFFLRHLAFTDLGYSTAVGPKMLANIVTKQKTIPYNWCAAQLAFFILFIISELFILSAMAYDRYVAICNPLLYTVIMSPREHIMRKHSESRPWSELFILSAMAYDRYVAICNPLLYTVIMSPRVSQKTCMETQNLTVLNEFILTGITDRPELQAPLFGLFLIIYVISMVGNLGMIILTKSYLDTMSQQNLTSLTEFILMGVTKQRELQVPLFMAFLTIYTITVVGNLGMIILTQVDSRLHTPMYFFIKQLAFIDLGNSTVICPKMLMNFVMDQNVISYYACATQLAFFLMFIISEFFILSAMAYDRYSAICNPLLYNVIMSQRRCHVLVGIPYLYNEFPNSFMAPENFTWVTEFVLTGVSGRPDLQIPLFFVFLVIYGLTVAGNLSIITLTSVDSQLQTPMYFFLRHLAIINLGNSTVIAPKMLINFLVRKKTITYYECATQLGGFLVFIVAEVSMLAVMAYDRYVAICNPLLYMVVLSRQICLLLVSLTYAYSFSTAIVTSSSVFSMSYCSSNVINHFYCDTVPLLALSCSDTYFPETVIFVSAATNLVCSMTIVLVSYFNIVLSILRIRSSEGRIKAFSTCASHMTAVTVFYGTLLFMYLQPRTSHSLDTDKMASVFYTLVIPMLNPMIYSLRNKDVKAALKRLLTNVFCSFKSM